MLLFDIELKKDAAAGPADITANVRYQSCNDTICLPPKRKTAMASITIDPSAKAAAIAIPAGYTLVPTARRTRCNFIGQLPQPPPAQPASGFSLFSC